MPRGRKPRTWVKMDCEGLLRGSINYLLPLEGQAVWLKMIALSEICGGRPGFIEDNNEKGLPIDYVAQELHCSAELLNLVLGKMKSDGAIKVNGSGSIELVNFNHYQFSEYDRQKPYRQAKREREKVDDDPDKYKKGRYGHLVVGTSADYERIKGKPFPGGECET